MAITEAGAAVLASGIAAAGSAATSGINYMSTSNMNRRSYVYNRRLADLAYKQNVEFWRMQNSYNTPGAQAARLRAAGINPNAAFGNGVDVSSGNAQDAPQLNYAEWNPKTPYFDDPVSAGINAAGNAAQIISSLQQNELTRANIVSTLASAGLSYAQAEYVAGKNVREGAKLAFEINELKARANAENANAEKLNIDKQEKEFIVAHQKEKFDGDMQYLASKIAYTDQQKKSIERAMTREDKLADSLISLQKKQAFYYSELSVLTSKQSDLSEEEKKQVSALIKQIEANEAKLKEEKKLVVEKTKLAEKDVDYYIYNHTYGASESFGNQFMKETEFNQFAPGTDEQMKDPKWRKKHGYK